MNLKVGKTAVTIKTILIGDSGVGKSSFMHRYVNHRFTNMSRTTLGTDFLSKTVNVEEHTVTLQIWAEKYHSLCTFLFRGTHCCMLVFDVTSKASFTALEKWRTEFLFEVVAEDPLDFPFIVLGNKTDLSPREVSAAEAQEWCEKIGAEYFEGSAKEDRHVEEPFLRAAERGLQQYKKHTLENTGHFPLTCEQPRETRNTCGC